MAATSARTCLACGSDDLIETRRGYAGTTDTPHQYVTCRRCGQVVYEIVSVSQRDIRLYRYEAGGVLARDGVTYQIKRMLKVGFDEYLLYLRVIELDRPEPPAELAEPAEVGDGELG
jgi:hypothetical protein